MTSRSPALKTRVAIDRSRFGHLYPFKSHYQTIGKWRCHYLDEGQGAPVLMLHGNPTWSFYYRRLVQGLSPACRTIVPDHLGCGLSDRPNPREYGYRLADRVRDLAVLIDALNLQEPITLILHDWGGMIGCCYALRHPERIARLIIMNTAAFLPPAGKSLPLRLALLRRCPGLAEFLVLKANLFARAAAIMASHKGLTRDVQAGLLAPYNTPYNRMATLKFVQDIPINRRDPSYALVSHVDRNLATLASKPILLLWGRHDFVFDMEYFEQWRRRFPAAEYHLLPTAGHYVLEDEPEAVLAYVQDFLKKHSIADMNAL